MRIRIPRGFVGLTINFPHFFCIHAIPQGYKMFEPLSTTTTDDDTSNGNIRNQTFTFKHFKLAAKMSLP